MKWPCDVAAWSAVTVEEDVTLLKRCVAFLAVAGHSRFKIWCFFFFLERTEIQLKPKCSLVSA